MSQSKAGHWFCDNECPRLIAFNVELVEHTMYLFDQPFMRKVGFRCLYCRAAAYYSQTLPSEIILKRWGCSLVQVQNPQGG